jgi:outer membrane cobalamin receptor
MALNDTITTIEAELEALKTEVAPATTSAPAPATPETIQAEPEVIVPATPEPQVHQAPAADINALTQLALDQAAARSVLEVAK